MGRHGISATARYPRDRGLERRILERLDLAAVVAHEVVMMVAADEGRLEPGHAVPQVDPLDEPELVEPLERAIHARDADARPSGAHEVVDLLRGQAAVLLAHELDHEPPGCSAAPAQLAKTPEGGVRP